MIIPTTYLAVLLLSIVSMICFASWANTFKTSSDKWRFELYYFDFAFGLLLTTIIAAATLGSFGTELSFADNMMVTGKRQIGFGVLAGFVINLATMLFLAAISVAGMAVTFPLALSFVMIINGLIRYFTSKESLMFLIGGSLVLLMGVGAMAAAFEAYLKQQNPGRRKLPIGKGIVLGIVSGILGAAASPLIEFSRIGDIGLGAYSIVFAMALGIFLSTPVLNIYFMNLPVHGEALTLGRYFKGTLKNHITGVFGGFLWACGQLCALLVAAPGGNLKETTINPSLAVALEGGVILLGMLWGMVIWKELQPAAGKIKTMLTVVLACVIGGTALIAISPMFAK